MDYNRENEAVEKVRKITSSQIKIIKEKVKKVHNLHKISDYIEPTL